jgi:hypothetical protein
LDKALWAINSGGRCVLNPTDDLPFATKRSLGDILDGLLGNLSGGVNRASGSEQAFRREVRNITEDDLVLRI